MKKEFLAEIVKEEEKFNSFVVAGLVLKLKIQDLGRLEQFIQNLHCAEFIFVESFQKHET
jgi:hypothetical protein